MITSLPPLNRQLLLYILDLLAVFASKSDLNKMTTPNLAAIFQPGILSHPQHDMSPPEYRLSQDVLIFLIENQDSFLIGMQGTAADPETVRDVQSGTPTRAPATPTTPGRSKTIIGRSSSNASTRAESARKLGDVQRNPSGASKLSKRSENGPTPVVAGMSPSTSVHRSNTVPSRRDGSSAHSPRFTRDKSSDPSTPVATSPSVGLDTSKLKSESLQVTPVAATAPTFPATPEVPSDSPVEGNVAAATIAPATAAVGAGAASATNRDAQTPRKESTPSTSPPPGTAEQSGERSAVQTPATSPGRFLDIFKQTPSSEADGRKPNKLQKRPPGPVSSLSSAQSSSHSLPKEGQQETTERSPVSPVTPTAGPSVVNEKTSEPSPSTLTPAPVPSEGVQAVPSDPSRNLSATDNSLRPTVSPSHSYHSGTESDADMVGDDLPKDQTAQPEKGKRRHRWRFSRSHNKLESSPAPSPNATGVLASREQTMSRSTIGSDGARKSFQEPTPLTSSTTDPMVASPKQGQTFSSSSTDPVFSDSEREKRSGPMSWIRDKMRGDRDKDRARTPDRNRERSESRQGMAVPTDALPVRGKSFERSRTDSEASAPGSTSAGLATTTSPASAAAASSIPASVPETEDVDDGAPPPVVPLSSDHNGTGQ